jgi:glycine reductase
MTLRLVSHRVKAVSLGPVTQFVAGRLTVATDDASRCFDRTVLSDVRFTWVSPGDSARIIKVLDAVEPRTKGPGGGGIFPGFLGAAAPQGQGTTHRLAGVAVIAAGHVPRAQEAVIEMSGEAQGLSPFGGLHNLVVEFTPASGAPWEQVDAALRVGTLRLAAWLAEKAGEGGEVVEVFEDVEVVEVVKEIDDLPHVGAITNLQTQGTFKDVFVYGKSFAGAAPRVMQPNELEDGAVVSGQFGHPSLKNPTYMYQNHPVVRELRARDGRDLRFSGLILAPEPVQAEEKAAVAAQAARLCAAAGFDGVVITKEGGGNADADISLKIDALADLEIGSVGLFAELAGPHGTAPSLVVPPEKGTALISTGNYDELVQLPAVARALGGDVIDLVGRPATDALELPTAVLYCALAPLGAGRLTCRDVA